MGKPHPLKCRRWDFRDVSSGLKILRDVLLGRQMLHHARFMPNLSPRTIPQPDIPKGPHAFPGSGHHTRSASKFVMPPVVAPIATGPPLPGSRCPLPADKLAFRRVPTPGEPYGWDGHCYYECVEEYPPRPCPPPDSKCDY